MPKRPWGRHAAGNAGWALGAPLCGAPACAGGRASQALSCSPSLSGGAARAQVGASVLAFLEPRPAVPVAYMPHEVRAVTAARAAFFAAQSPAQAAAWRARFGARCAGLVAKVALEGGYFGEHCDDALQARRPTRLCVGVLYVVQGVA